MRKKDKILNIVRRRGVKVKMINDRKRQIVYELLMMPIQCTRYSNGKPIMKMVNSVIKTTQTYYPFKIEVIPLDPDMSDFAVGFYEIIYKYLIKGEILDRNDAFSDKDFAGDTMNSFNTIANLVPEAGPTTKQRTPKDKWPEWLQKYYSNYHCLANFWILPMVIGRKFNNEWCKGSYDKSVQDYMDRFLSLYKANFQQYKILHPGYFENIDSFEGFARLHILIGSHIYENSEIYIFSNNEAETIVKNINNRIKLRATAICESEYAEELWEYFFKNGLLGYRETYLQPDEYPLNKEIYPYGYECPKCSRIIANDENYSIPPVCNECSRK